VDLPPQFERSSANGMSGRHLALSTCKRRDPFPLSKRILKRDRRPSLRCCGYSSHRDGLMSPPTGAVGLPPTESDETAGNHRCWRIPSVPEPTGNGGEGFDLARSAHSGRRLESTSSDLSGRIWTGAPRRCPKPCRSRHQVREADRIRCLAVRILVRAVTSVTAGRRGSCSVVFVG
jgi:hypothetical protein